MTHTIIFLNSRRNLSFFRIQFYRLVKQSIVDTNNVYIPLFSRLKRVCHSINVCIFYDLKAMERGVLFSLPFILPKKDGVTC